MGIKIRSTREKVLVLLFGVMLAIGAALIVWTYYSDKTVGEANALARINSISATVAANTDQRRIQRIITNYPTPGSLEKKTRDAWYYTTHVNLHKTAEANNLQLPITILVLSQKEIQVLVTSSKAFKFRGPYGKQANVIAHYFNAGGGANLIDTEIPRWISLSPITNNEQETIAVVSVELPHQAVVADAWQNLCKNAMVFLAILCMMILLLKRSIGTWLQHDESNRKVLSDRNHDIEQSLAYANKIQKALVPDPTVYEKEFIDHFLINMPKESISGDFHWFKKLDDHRSLMAISDCTGHGLSGAMMVAVGCSALNEVVDEDNWKDPADILFQLNKKMIKHLSQDSQKKGAGDGMDIALCLIDTRDNKVLFSGAYRPLYWVHKGQLTIINGDRQPIGGNHHGEKRKFSCHQISFQPKDRIYLFSDGYVDQFGGPDNRKFLTSRFNKLLEQNLHLSLTSQAKILEKTFKEWKGGEEQVDDVCMLAVELN